MRPILHFTAQTGWINDPHGITYRDGRYHHFFQYVPGSVVWASNCHWGHAVGADMLSLEQLPVALAPGDGDDGIWTGALVTDDHGAATIYYTSVVEPHLADGRIRTATPVDDDWLQWRKGPIVVRAPGDPGVLQFRDPFLLRDTETDTHGWRMLVGAGRADGTAVVFSYSAPDVGGDAEWRTDGIAVERSTTLREPAWTGSMWECPQLFEIDGRDVLLFSIWEDEVLHSVAYGVGRFAGGRFTADTWGRLSFGPSYYAPSFFRDAAGAPALLFWMRGVHDLEQGWAGAHSVPHRLRLVGERLIATPHPDVERYRGTVASDGVVGGLAADVTWHPDAAGAELTVVTGGATALRLAADDGRLVATGANEPSSMPYSGGPVRVILDGPTAEISTADGVLGLVIAPAGDSLRVRGAGAVTHPLARHT